MRQLITPCGLVIILNGLAIRTPAADIYVDHLLADDCRGTYCAVNRDGSGSDGFAYNTPQEAADAAKPGDTVYFRAGTYFNHADLRDRAVVMNVLTSGTVHNPITYTNYRHETAILSGMRPNDTGHFFVLTLGVAASDRQAKSGQGIQNIVIDGLIVEGASRTALSVNGPADQTASAKNPTENIVIRNVVARNNSGPNGSGGGIGTRGKVIHVLIEYCEAHSNTGTGIHFGRISKSWHNPEPEDDMSAAQYCVIRNCLAHDNIHPSHPGNTDGIAGSHMYRCTNENNAVLNNSDDGMDIYASIETTVRGNIIFGHRHPGGNNAGLKFSAGGGGRHAISGNIVLHSDGYSFEGSNPSNRLREYYPSRIYGNLAYNGRTGFNLGTSYNRTYPGYRNSYLRNNIALDNGNHDVRLFSDIADCDCNFIGDAKDLEASKALGHDNSSLTGEPGLLNAHAAIDTSFRADWDVRQKLNHLRTQITAAFGLRADSQLIDRGALIKGYHCPYADDHRANPMDPQAPGRHWRGSAPDIGALEYGLDP